jgi:hypothetical protein
VTYDISSTGIARNGDCAGGSGICTSDIERAYAGGDERANFSHLVLSFYVYGVVI